MINKSKRKLCASAFTSILALAAFPFLSGGAFADQKAPELPASVLPFEKLFGGPFSLIDHHGKSVTDQTYRGKFMLIYFGYTFCPDICPTNLQHMANALDALGKKSTKITPLFIGIDPERDKVEALKDYVANFGDTFIGLSGTETQIRTAAKSYRIHRRKVLPAGETDKSNYLVDHSSITYLIGPDGKFLTLFPHNTDGKTMAKRIANYISKQQAGS